MASSLEYAYTCQVCFEDFEETGDHVPRLLPCTHTLCQTCVGQLIRRYILECPECRQKHRAINKEKTFPQNKYILVNIQRRPTLKEEQGASSKQSKVDLCERHGRPKTLYCVEDNCQELICHLCLKYKHRNHDFEEEQQMLEEKCNMLAENVKIMRKKLLVHKEKLLMAKEDAEKNTTDCTEKIAKAKDEQLKIVVKMMTKLYDQMIAKVTDNFADLSFDINNKTNEIDDSLIFLADISESSKKVTSVADILELIAEVNTLGKSIRMFAEDQKIKLFHYDGRQMFTLDDLQKMIGLLDSKEARVNLEPLRKLSFPLKTIQSASHLNLEGKYVTVYASFPHMMLVQDQGSYSSIGTLMNGVWDAENTLDISCLQGPR